MPKGLSKCHSGLSLSVFGLPALQERFAAQGYEFPTGDEHTWHEIAEIEPTEDSPTLGIPTDEIVQRFPQAAARGWARDLRDD